MLSVLTAIVHMEVLEQGCTDARPEPPYLAACTLRKEGR